MSGDENSGAHAHDEAAERSVVGVLLLNRREHMAEARRRLLPEDFYLPAHREIFAACCRLDERGDPIEAAAVVQELSKARALSGLPGGPVYLSELFSEAPAATSLVFYVEAVKQAATRRALAAMGLHAQQMARNGDGTSPAAIIESLRAELDGLATSTLSSELPTFQEVIGSTLREIEQLQTTGVTAGVSTGFVELDKQLNGLQPGQMIVIAARPGLGKSALALDMARHAAIRQEKSVLLFSLEMSHAELGMRAVSAEAYVDGRKLRDKGALNDDEWEKITRASARMHDKTFGIDDDPTVTIADIRAKAIMWKRRHGLDLIIIDYLQLMNPVVRSTSRQQEVSEISRGVKLLAKELDVPVVALSQLNRGPEQRQDRKPVISDLRESGSIEQDADVVLLLHREDAYDRESPRAGEADVVIAKQRSGPTGQVTLSWLGKFSRFDNRSDF